MNASPISLPATGKIKFVVINENMLCYVDPRQPLSAGILWSSIVKGATHTWRDGPYPLPNDNKRVRPAKIADFDVLYRGGAAYRDDSTRYEFPTE